VAQLPLHLFVENEEGGWLLLAQWRRSTKKKRVPYLAGWRLNGSPKKHSGMAYGSAG